MNALHAELRFPKPPFRIDRYLVDSPPPDHALASYLDQIRTWRSTVLEFLRKSGGGPVPEVECLTQRARMTLATFLASSCTQGVTRYAVRSPYNIRAFPGTALEAVGHPKVNLVLGVLRWRARAVDYLSDVWDVMGESELDVFECGAISRFLDPASGAGICHVCLTEFAPDKLNVYDHSCLLLAHVQAKWPVVPKRFLRRNAMLMKGKKWWQF